MLAQNNPLKKPTFARPPWSRIYDTETGKVLENWVAEGHSTPERINFAAVSYVWHPSGCTYTFDNQPTNWSPLMRNVVARICMDHGVRYVWIDGLCIPQADTQSARILKAKEMSLMSMIYAQSKVCFVVSGGDYEHEDNKFVDESQWSSRVWTFQEKILSTTLVFCTLNRDHSSSSEGWKLSYKYNHTDTIQRKKLFEFLSSLRQLMFDGKRNCSYAADRYFGATSWSPYGNLISYDKDLDPIECFQTSVLELLCTGPAPVQNLNLLFERQIPIKNLLPDVDTWCIALLDSYTIVKKYVTLHLDFLDLIPTFETISSIADQLRVWTSALPDAVGMDIHDFSMVLSNDEELTRKVCVVVPNRWKKEENSTGLTGILNFPDKRFTIPIQFEIGGGVSASGCVYKVIPNEALKSMEDDWNRLRPKICPVRQQATVNEKGDVTSIMFNGVVRRPTFHIVTSIRGASHPSLRPAESHDTYVGISCEGAGEKIIFLLPVTVLSGIDSSTLFVIWFLDVSALEGPTLCQRDAANENHYSILYRSEQSVDVGWGKGRAGYDNDYLGVTSLLSLPHLLSETVPVDGDISEIWLKF
ncbi:hypothetical protein HK098_004362 [Nowakowskiella sp. JEL0407]|nr:hypothetical protein HK098_004362 [Nowakowskiella sp. JEL0407]